MPPEMSVGPIAPSPSTIPQPASPPPPNTAPIANDNTDQGSDQDDPHAGFHGAQPANDNAAAEPQKPAIPDVIDAKNLAALADIRVRGIVVNGEEVELPLAKALEHARLGTAAFKKFDEAKQMREEVTRKEGQLRGVVKQAAEKPLDFIRRLGKDAEQNLYNAIREELRRESLPEPERKALDLEERERSFAERERRLREAEEQRRQQQEQARQAQEARVYQEQILSGMVKVMDAAKFAPVAGDAAAKAEANKLRAECVERMAAYIDQAHRVGAQVSIQQAFEQASADMERVAVTYARRLETDRLATLLGDQSVAALRQREVAKLQRESAPSAPQPKPPGTAAKPKPVSRQPAPDLDKLSPSNFSAFLNNAMRGR
jgi:dTMP kinase